MIDAFNDVSSTPLPEASGIAGTSYLDNIAGMQIGAGSNVFRGDESGIWLGASKFADAPFSVDMEGILTATGAIISGNIDIGGADNTSFHVDINGNVWLGAATFATAPFTISNIGAVTIGTNAWHTDISGNMWWGNSATYAGATIKISSAGSIDFTTGNFSGTLSSPSGTLGTVTGGTIRTAASGSRVELLGSDNSFKIYSGTVTRIKAVAEGLYIYGEGALTFSAEGSSTTVGVQGVTSGNFLVAANATRLDLAGNEVRISSLNNNDVVINSSDDVLISYNGNFKLNGTTKTAIIFTSQGYRSLYCVESPEVWFFDFCRNKKTIDPLFLEVTEGEKKFIKCDDNTYQVWRKRKGFENTRFEEKTKKDYIKNNKFWNI